MTPLPPRRQLLSPLPVLRERVRVRVCPCDESHALTPALSRNTGRGSMCRRGFTLIEILVAIGIIVLLAAIAIPAVIHAWRAAQKTRVAADLQSISAGLEAYKLDF